MKTKLPLISSAKDVMGSSAFVCVFVLVSRIAQKPQDVSPQKLVDACGIGQGRTLYILVWIQIRHCVQDFMYFRFILDLQVIVTP